MRFRVVFGFILLFSGFGGFGYIFIARVCVNILIFL